MMTTIQNQIKAAALKEPKTVEQQFLKLSEEVGEAAQAYLAAMKVSGNDYKQLTKVDVQEELVDVLLVTYAILYKLDISDEALNALLTQKVTKWLSHQKH